MINTKDTQLLKIGKKRKEKIMSKIKRVLITDGMSENKMLILTDAPKKRIKKWCENVVKELETNTNSYFDSLQEEGFRIKIIYDSSMENNDIFSISEEYLETIGWDLHYELSDYQQKETKEISRRVFIRKKIGGKTAIGKYIIWTPENISDKEIIDLIRKDECYLPSNIIHDVCIKQGWRYECDISGIYVNLS